MVCVIDTNVLLSGLRSRQGASFQLIEHASRGRLVPVVTVPLVLEYEDVLSRPGLLPHFTASDTRAFIDWWVSIAQAHAIHFLWRPHLPDPKDDMMLEAALAAGSCTIVTFNLRHFHGSRSLGITAITPQTCLQKILHRL
ncbi:MAG: putative toxin-antitoxin system toxin component, PIN family [Opitutaceae bacterium]|jgi:putative PIN family toxin of toxin-antitoxin system|nr:putative toxin-antitoxin system toxin component, PIN family [Opitutaceae bacterium]